jgi:hypothetical protein
MIKVLKEIKPNWFLIELEGTRYYQIWQKWELFEVLLDYKSNSNQTLWDEDLPMPYENLEKIVGHLDDALKEKYEKKISKNLELAELNIQLNLLQTRIKKIQDGKDND